MARGTDPSRARGFDVWWARHFPAEQPVPSASPSPRATTAQRYDQRLLTEGDVQALVRREVLELVLPSSTVVTPLARELLQSSGIKVVLTG